MANGRLGKASVPSKRTETIYTNSSGSEASVSLVATSPVGSTLFARIDDSSDAIETSTNLTTETFDDTYLRYIVKDGAWDDTNNTSYGGRMGLVGNGSLSTSFYDGTTTYETNYPLHEHIPSFSEETAKDIGTYVVPYTSTSYAYVEYDDSRATEDILKASWGHDITTGNAIKQTTAPVGLLTRTSSYNAGYSVDPYLPYAVGVRTNGYMTTSYLNSSGTFVYPSESSGSSWYQQIGTSVSTNDYQKLRLMNGVFLMDAGAGGSVSNSAGMVWIFDTRDPGSDIQDAWADYSDTTYNRKYRINIGNGFTSGNVTWFEFNPNDSYWYVGFRSASGIINSIRFQGDFFDNGSSGVGFTLPTTQAYVSRGWEWLGNDNITEQTTGQFNSSDWTFTSKRIGPSLWALYGSSTSATDIWLSKDLKTWVSVSDYYGTSYKYYKIEEDTIVSMASDSTSLIGLRTAITSVGEDGILEQGQPMLHLERSGLVLSNGDRIVTFNQGDHPISIQIMGYEGN